jgi:hypothetical protein
LDAVVSLRALAVPTRDRPQALGRCLDSHLANASRYDRRPAVTVIDGATSREARSRTRTVLRQIAGRWHAPVRYVDQGQKRRFAARLAQATGVEPAVAAFALLDVDEVGSDTGGNRNALLLEHAGRAFLSVDDDTACDLHARPGADAGFALSPTYDPTEVTLYTSLEEARATVPALEDCLLALHERLLGRSVTACLAERGGAVVTVPRLPPSHVPALTSGRAHITVTQSGILGDSGARYPSFYLFDHAVGLTALPPDQRYDELCTSRQTLRAVRVPTACAGSFLMSTCVAFDNRNLEGAVLPPFFPVGRGTDLFFGQLLRTCRDDSWVGHLPAAVLHAPADARRHPRGALWPPAPRAEMRLVLSLCLDLCAAELRACASGDPRLRLLGRKLSELGALPWAELEALLQPRRLALIARSLELGRRQLARPDAQRRWRVDLAALLDRRAQELRQPSALLPQDLGAGRPANDRARLAGSMLVRFGSLCQVWPELVAAARRLGEREQAMSRPLEDRSRAVLD